MRMQMEGKLKDCLQENKSWTQQLAKLKKMMRPLRMMETRSGKVSELADDSILFLSYLYFMVKISSNQR